jgi:hypothetical protein
MSGERDSETYDLFQQGREHLRKGMPAQANGPGPRARDSRKVLRTFRD